LAVTFARIKLESCQIGKMEYPKWGGGGAKEGSWEKKTSTKLV